MPLAYDTDAWFYVPAKYIGPRRTGTVRLIVVHTAEASERITGAEDLAKYGQNPDYISSWHICVDGDTVIQCVKDSFVAYAAPGANHDGIQMELVCSASQTKKQWLDHYSIASLAIAADAVAQYCLKYNIPPKWLSDIDLREGKKGIVGHDQISRVYMKSDHKDPGMNFPWTRFIRMVESFVAERR